MTPKESCDAPGVVDGVRLLFGAGLASPDRACVPVKTHAATTPTRVRHESSSLRRVWLTRTARMRRQVETKW